MQLTCCPVHPHRAAYKGVSDTMRLLLVMDARLHLADKDGCTPLHWAAIKGAGEACQLLLQGGAGSLLTTKDVTGSTPPQLAAQKGHRYVSHQHSTAAVIHCGSYTVRASS